MCRQFYFSQLIFQVAGCLRANSYTIIESPTHVLGLKSIAGSRSLISVDRYLLALKFNLQLCFP